MSGEGPRVVQGRSTRNVVVPDSFNIESIDRRVEEGLGPEERKKIRDERGIPPENSILHPDQPKFVFAKRAVGDQKPLVPTPPPADPKPLLANGAPVGDLGPGLKKLVGRFAGKGFNMILRPQNGPDNRDRTPRETLLEMNFTAEKLTFLDWKVLKDVPNRGFDKQEDVNLRGIPYTQEIEDLTNHETGKIDLPVGQGQGIHFEQGLFMRTPALTPWKPFQLDAQGNPLKDANGLSIKERGPTILGPTITRMASIPHGTTINAQCPEPPAKEVAGAPVVGPFSPGELAKTIIFPFPFKILDRTKQPPKEIRAVDPIGDAIGPDFFPQLDFASDTKLDRLPVKFKETRESGAITAEQYKNPVNFLKANNDKIKILDHVTFTVDTQPKFELWGGGTANIAQLAEKQVKVTSGGVVIKDIGGNEVHETHVAKKAGVSSANANAVKVTCSYWISTVEEIITIPIINSPPLINPNLPRTDDNVNWPLAFPKATAGVPKPSFQVRLEKNDEAFDATVRYTQIQYSQNVTLDFGGLSWPHISVATLVPSDPLPIKTEGAGNDFVRVKPKKV